MIIGLSDFLQVYENKVTICNYRVAITDFIKGIYETEDESAEKVNKLSIRYINEVQIEKREWINDLLKYTEKLKQSKAAYTTREYTRSVKYWLECNQIYPNLIEKKKLERKLPAKDADIIEGEMSKQKLKELYSGLYSLKSKCMFLIMAGSGTRISETGKIKKSDINFESCPVSIRIRAENTKTKQGRQILVTNEAAELLRELCSGSEEEIFKHGVMNFRYEWKTVIEKSGDYEILRGRKRYTYHPHMLRKWFLSEFSLHASREIAEHLAGHQGYLSKSYRRYNQEEITSEFKKAEQYLSILNYNEFSIISGTCSEAYYEA